MDYKTLLLNRLLDKFEKSKAYLDPSVSRRILLHLRSDDFPEYDIENSQTRELINAAVLDLAQKGLLQYEWLKHEEENIMAKVWLQLDKTDEAYRQCRRTAKSDKAAAVWNLVRNSKQKITSPWIAHFLNDTLESILNKKSPLPYLPEEDHQAEAVLLALEAIDQLAKAADNGECLERVFSLRCYGDSKYFERHVKRKLIWVIKKYLLAEIYQQNGLEESAVAEIGDEEVLAQIGIVKAPELLEFCGGMQALLESKPVDFSVFRQGVAINSFTAASLENIDFAPQVQRILFIENKANYVDYIFHQAQNHEFVVYHGGFYSPAKGRLFQKFYEAAQRKGLEFFHWGDIDLGGFRIFQRLKKMIIPELKPYFMDREALLSMQSYWGAIDQNYRAKLEKLQENEDFAIFFDVIELMLEHNCKLEQEAFLISKE